MLDLANVNGDVRACAGCEKMCMEEQKKSGKAASVIKARLLDYLLKKDPNSLFGNEIFFGSKLRAADIISLSDALTAYEVKSSEDNLNRLEEQLKDYKRVFDFVYVVTTQKHLKNVEEITSRHVGILLIEGDAVKIFRKAQKNIRLSKIEIVSSIPTAFLSSFFCHSRAEYANEIRKRVMKENLTDVKNCFFTFIRRKLTTCNARFRQERSSPTHFEDVLLLNCDTRVII